MKFGDELRGPQEVHEEEGEEQLQVQEKKRVHEKEEKERLVLPWPSITPQANNGLCWAISLSESRIARELGPLTVWIRSNWRLNSGSARAAHLRPLRCKFAQRQAIINSPSEP